MQLRITGHHVEITDALRSYVEEKIQRIERHFDHVTNVHVVLRVEKLQQKAEATLHMSGGDIYADDTQEDMYAAIDGLSTKLDRQVLKHKEKLHQRSRGQGRPEIPDVIQ
jgi:putative sigma-54 modulation protein